MTINRIRTTHVGSLVRPPELVALLLKRQDGEAVPDATMASQLEQSVFHAVAAQKAAGVDIVSDGEFGKVISWAQYALTRLGGIELRSDVPRTSHAAT